MAIRIRSIRSDPRWVNMVVKYRFSWVNAAVDLFGFSPTPQQVELLTAVEPIGSRTTVSSGHGTGKSSQIAIVVLLFMLFYPNSRVVLVANKLDQVKIAVFKNLKVYWRILSIRYPWLSDYFTLNETKFFANAEKGIWEVSSKASKAGNEESLAGEHAEHLLWIIDEASGLSDKTFEYVEGSLTQVDNRVVLLSQPTRDGGYFWETHNNPSLAKVWTRLTFSSEDSPIVTDQFLINAFLQFGMDRESAQYMIRVRGMFPKSLSGYLLSMDDAMRATMAKPKVKKRKGWGWALSADVGNGRDSSVILIARIWGDGEERRIEPHVITEYEGTIDPVNFGREIVNIVKTGEYPNISVIIDAGGVGAGTCKVVEEQGINVHKLLWGDPMFSDADKKLYLNQRAYASVMMANAIKKGYAKLDRNSKTLNQASKIPYAIDDFGRFVIVKKETMKTKYNIKSPDRFDAYCFLMLVDVVPATNLISQHTLCEREHVGGWAKEVTTVY